MKDYLPFLKTSAKPLGFGFSLTLFSSLGQTFFISLFVPSLMRDLGISNSYFGSVYAIATISSSIIFMFLGHQVDHLPLRPYVYKTLGLLAASTWFLSLVIHPLMLPFALLGLRFSGQGLMGHISQTVMSRHFDLDRGKALSITSLGFSAGEALFPILVAIAIPVLGWRATGMVNGLVLIGIMYPYLRSIPLEDYHTNEPSQNSKPQWSILRDKGFLQLMPSALILSLTNTAVLFNQLLIVDARGWNPAWYSMVFAGYAMAKLVFGVVSGPLIDRFSATKLFIIHHLPIIVGLALFGMSRAPWTAVVYLLAAGFSLGLGGPIRSAAIAEVHGLTGLGGVRAVYTAFMVLGSALGPLLFGVLLDQGVSFEPLLLGSSVLLLLSILPAIGLQPLAPRNGVRE